LLAFWAALAYGADPQAPPVSLVSIRARMVENLQRLPDYTCLQTIERWRRAQPKKPLRFVDRVRLEVGLVNGNEVFSWPGESSFEDASIEDIVPGGAIGNGDFGLAAKIVFESDAPHFTWMGEDALNGARALRWDYVVDQDRGGFMVTGDTKAVVGTHGAIWVDATSLDIARLSLFADNIPAATKVTYISDEIDYSRVKIAESAFLLPRASELHLIHDDGVENVNRDHFGDCHEYTGISRLVDSDSDNAGTPANLPQTTVDIPLGAVLELELQTPISSESSAIGDPLILRLKRPVKANGELIFDKGTLVRGRLTMFRKIEDDGNGYLVGVKLLEVDSASRRAAVNAALRFNAFAGDEYAQKNGRFVVSPSKIPGNLGSVFFQYGDEFHMKRGATLRWHIVPATQGPKQ